MLLKAKHPELTSEKSYLSTAPIAGATSLLVKSVAGIAANQYVLIGNLGDEKSEIVLCSAVTSATNTLTVGATKFGHAIDAPVQVIKYNQVKFYKSSTIDGTYTLVQTVDLDVDDTETTYDYTAGAASDYYRVSYYNSNSATESQKSDPLLGSGYSRRALASIIKEVRTYVGDRPSDEELIMAINSAQDVICGLDDRWYFAHKSATLTVAAAHNEADMPADFLTLDFVRSTSILKHITLQKFLADYATNTTDTPTSYTIDDTTEEILFDATASTGYTATLYYWAKPTPLAEYTDETIIPNPAAVVFWVASKIEASKKNTDTSGIYWQEYTAQLKGMTNRRKGGEKNFSIG
jgi:hypothetical protein